MVEHTSVSAGCVVTANELVVIGESPRIHISWFVCVVMPQHPVYDVDRAEAMLNSWYGRGECLRNVRIMSPFERN